MVGDVQGSDSPAVPGGGVRVPGEEEVDHVYLEQWHNIYPRPQITTTLLESH